NGQLGYPKTGGVGDSKTPGGFGPVELGAGRTATAISIGNSDSCALLDNGTVRCWGANGNGQLGYGNTTQIGDDETPGSVGPLNLGLDASGMDMGESHSCARLVNGTVRCWGLGTSGQLGYGSTASIGDNETPNTAGPVEMGA